MASAPDVVSVAQQHAASLLMSTLPWVCFGVLEGCIGSLATTHLCVRAYLWVIAFVGAAALSMVRVFASVSHRVCETCSIIPVAEVVTGCASDAD